MHSKLMTALLFAVCVFLFSSCRHTEPKNESVQRMEHYLNELEKAGFFGTVLVEVNGEKVISKGYGYSNKAKGMKNSPATVFDIGSVTKQFTAAGILKLESQGKLSTEDKISMHFQNVPKGMENITIHDLLRHQSGLISNVGKDYEKISKEEFLSKVFASELMFEPGTGFSYSNVGYSLLAMIVEKVSGQSYESFLYANFWKPLGMESTGYTRPELDSATIAVNYYENDSVWGKPTEKEWDTDAPYWHLKGNGGILSTTEDMYKWHRGLMDNKVLSEKAVHKLYHPRLRPGEKDESYYAYGWDFLRTSRNTRRLWHNGTNRIYYADFMRFIDEGATLILLSNKSHPVFNDINRELSKIIFNAAYIPEIPAPDNETNRNFTYRIIKTIEESGLEEAKKAYRSRQENEDLLEFLMRDEGFRHIDNGQPETAVQIFEMNVFAHPKSAKALQGLGEGYMETGKPELAIKYLKQSLAIDPDNPFVKDLLVTSN